MVVAGASSNTSHGQEHRKSSESSRPVPETTEMDINADEIPAALFKAQSLWCIITYKSIKEMNSEANMLKSSESNVFVVKDSPSLSITLALLFRRPAHPFPLWIERITLERQAQTKHKVVPQIPSHKMKMKLWHKLNKPIKKLCPYRNTNWKTGYECVLLSRQRHLAPCEIKQNARKHSHVRHSPMSAKKNNRF